MRFNRALLIETVRVERVSSRLGNYQQRQSPKTRAKIEIRGFRSRQVNRQYSPLYFAIIANIFECRRVMHNPVHEKSNRCFFEETRLRYKCC